MTWGSRRIISIQGGKSAPRGEFEGVRGGEL